MAPDVVLLTTSEVATLLRIDESTVRRWTYQGKLRAVPVPGRNKRYRRTDIEAMVNGDSAASAS